MRAGRAIAIVLISCLPLAARAAASHRAPEERPEKLARQHLDVEPLAIVGGTIHPVTSPAIVRGTLLLEGGTIKAILPEGGRVPQGWQVIDAHGLEVYPGLVAASASDLGLNADATAGGADAIIGRPVSDNFDPFSSAVELAVSGGITSAVVWANAFQAKGAFQGRAALLKMSFGEPRGLIVADPVALGASPLILSPGTRRDLEAALKKERDHAERRPRKNPHASRADEPDALQELAKGRIPLVADPERPGAILAMAEMADTLSLQLVLNLSGDAWQVAERLAAVHASAVQHVRPSWGTPRADRRVVLGGGWRPDAPTLLTRAGVPTAVCPLNDGIRVWGVGGRDLLDLPMEAAFAQRSGLSADEALAAITIVPARIFGADKRIGSLEVGKDADVILADGDLLDYRTFVRKTIVNGRVAYDAATSRHWKNVVALRDGVGSAAPPSMASPALAPVAP